MLRGLKKFINTRLNIFSSEKVLSNKLFNFFGCQVLRILIYNFIVFFKRKFFFSGKYYSGITSQVNEIKNKGFLIFNNFLSDEEFEEVKNYFNKEVEKISSFTNDKYEKKFSISGMTIDRENIQNIKNPWYKIFLKKKELGRIIEVLVAKKISSMKDSSFYFEKLHRSGKKENLPNDPQNIFHRDTFYCSLKFIFLMDDVSSENGPFSYVEGSNKISKWKMEKEFLGSLKNEKNLRDEKLKFNEKKIKVFCQKKNTLILFDSSGFHKRLPTEINYERNTIRFTSREHPFSLSI